MATSLKRLSVTLQPEWEPDLDELKRTTFYDKTKADVIRYLIELGLQTWRDQNNSSQRANKRKRIG